MLVGTAQWGLPYGITNSQGRLADRIVEDLVADLRLRGLDDLDTAPGYGDAESRIGAFAQGFQIQTKISASGKSSADLESSLQKSLRSLKIGTIHSLLVHDWYQLNDSEKARVANFLEEFKGRGLVRRIGISGYDEKDILSAFLTFDKLDLVQVPVNAIDQRLNASHAVNQLRADGGSVQARSLLLQGLLVKNSCDTGKAQHEALVQFRQLAHRYGKSSLEFALDYIKSQDWVDEVIIAPTSVIELDEICDAWNSHTLDGVDWPSLASLDLNLIDPRRWI